MLRFPAHCHGRMGRLAFQGLLQRNIHEILMPSMPPVTGPAGPAEVGETGQEEQEEPQKQGSHFRTLSMMRWRPDVGRGVDHK